MPRVRLFAPLLIALSVVATGFGQERAFRTGTDTVSVYASVVDRSGRLVADLTKDDFEVFDDGQRQDITLFAFDGVVGEECDVLTLAVVEDLEIVFREIGPSNRQPDT